MNEFELEFEEGKTLYHTIDVRGHNGELVTPESLKYKITDDKENILVPWTNLPNSTTVIEIPPNINTIASDNGNTGRFRYITLVITHNNNKKIVKESEYFLKKLIGINSINDLNPII